MDRSENIHMIAICGTGMAALAGLLKKAGHRVNGSDAHIYPPMSTLLDKETISCKKGFSPEHIACETDRVIIGNAVSKDNVEVVETLRRKLPYLSMASALRHYFLKDKQSLVVTGTHGKTTTASLLATVLSSAGCKPGMLIGGWVKNFDSNHHLGTGDYFVVEGDEYDTAFFDKGPKFLHYRPAHAILTSIEFDHADIFPDLSAIQEAFQKFVQLLPPMGRLLAAAGSREIDHLLSELHSRSDATCQIERYGTDLDDDSDNHQNDWQATSVRMEGALTHFDVTYHRHKIGEISSPLIGRHNLQNSLAVIALCHHLGLSWQAIQSGIGTFQGVKRRQEIIGCVRDIIVMDDFAHHPTAISETLAALRLRYPKRRLWVVFEPRSATSRRNHFQDAFVAAFRIADRTVLTDIHAPEKIPPNQRLNPQKIIDDLLSLGKSALFIPSPDQIINILCPQLQAGDLVCIMSSGDFGGIHQKLLTRLRTSPQDDAVSSPS